METVSRELYMEVFKPDTSAITLNEYDVVLEDETLYLRNRHTLFDADEVCVYKAQHKCKEWAYVNGYVISSHLNTTSTTEHPMKRACAILDEQGVFFEHNTEPEAIFQACQYILDNKEQS